jgi:hypothetical protein
MRPVAAAHPLAYKVGGMSATGGRGTVRHTAGRPPVASGFSFGAGGAARPGRRRVGGPGADVTHVSRRRRDPSRVPVGRRFVAVGPDGGGRMAPVLDVDHVH